mgnify:CR=1 FL=1
MTRVPKSRWRRRFGRSITAGRRAFTLVELLVVVAIIAILASLLLTGLGRAHQAGRLAKCRSNVRQLSVALQMYLGDHNFYPHASLMDASPPQFWTSFLVPYLSDSSFVLRGLQPDTAVRPGASTVFRCPSVRPAIHRSLGTIIDYGYNSMGHARQGLGVRVDTSVSPVRFSPVHESEVVVPSDTIALGDGMSRIKGFVMGGPTLERNVVMYSHEVLQGIEEQHQRSRRRHGDRVSVGFADGHVQVIGFQRLFYDEADSALRRWNRDYLPHRESLSMIP